MIVEPRPMSVYVDDELIGENCRKRLQGKATINLLPDFHLLDINGLNEKDTAKLKNATMIKVVGEDDSVLCSGEIEDLYVHYSETNEISTVCISDGKQFWDKAANMTLAKGLSVRTTIMSVLGDIPLGSFLADDKRFTRGQTMVGRVPYIVSTLAKSLGARAYYTQSQVHVVSIGKASSVLDLNEKEIISETAIATGVYAVKTKVKGYPVGLMTRLGEDKRQFRLASQSINADNWDGVWDSELLLIDESFMSADGLGGG